jgi:hypothetical protein
MRKHAQQSVRPAESFCLDHGDLLLRLEHVPIVQTVQAVQTVNATCEPVSGNSEPLQYCLRDAENVGAGSKPAPSDMKASLLHPVVDHTNLP